MLGEDVISVLKANLPRFSGDFTDNHSILSLTQTGGVATATTAGAHGLQAGSIVTMDGIRVATAIASISHAAGMATVTTSTDHDLTEQWHKTVTLSGATEGAFNGTFTLLRVPNRRSFVFGVAPTAPASATGSPVLLEDRIDEGGYAGMHQVQSATTTSFSYSVSPTAPSPARGTIVARTEPRITGADERASALKSYTASAQDDLWLFVIMGAVTASKSREAGGDQVANSSTATDVRQLLVGEIELLLFVPRRNDIAGRQAMDTARAAFAAISQSIAGLNFDTELPSNDGRSLIFVRHDMAASVGNSAYVHSFQFEQSFYLNRVDQADHTITRAFRDLYVTLDHEGQQMTNAINLDDEPL